MKVKAKNGLKVPYEGKANSYIQGEIVEVPRTNYYLRQIMRGDLIQINEDKKQEKVKEKKNG